MEQDECLLQLVATLRANFERALVIVKGQATRDFVPANASLAGDILNSLTSTFENKRDLDPATCDGMLYFQINFDNSSPATY